MENKFKLLLSEMIKEIILNEKSAVRYPFIDHQVAHEVIPHDLIGSLADENLDDDELAPHLVASDIDNTDEFGPVPPNQEERGVKVQLDPFAKDTMPIWGNPGIRN
jgi:hypothetical protein